MSKSRERALMAVGVVLILMAWILRAPAGSDPMFHNHTAKCAINGCTVTDGE